MRSRALNIAVRRILLALLVPGSMLAVGCGSEAVPACVDVSWDDRNDAAELTGPPSFSASQIVAGEPLSMRVPVNENTLAVRVNIQSADDTRVASPRKETAGDEIVELPLEDTDLPDGVYRASFIDLSGGGAAQDSEYRNRDRDMPYILIVEFAAESAASCLTDIPAATFTVVSNASTLP